MATGCWGVKLEKNFNHRSFGIKDLGEKSFQIFEFKGLTCKIFRNRELLAFVRNQSSERNLGSPLPPSHFFKVFILKELNITFS